MSVSYYNDNPRYVRIYKAVTDKGIVHIVSTSYNRAMEVLTGMNYMVMDLRGLLPLHKDRWFATTSINEPDEIDMEDK